MNQITTFKLVMRTTLKKVRDRTERWEFSAQTTRFDGIYKLRQGTEMVTNYT